MPTIREAIKHFATLLPPEGDPMNVQLPSIPKDALERRLEAMKEELRQRGEEHEIRGARIAWLKRQTEALQAIILGQLKDGPEAP